MNGETDIYSDLVEQLKKNYQKSQRFLLLFKRGFPTTRNEIWAWIWLSFGSLPLLILGLAWLVFARDSASGGLLVGCSIIAEWRVTRWPMSGYIGGRLSRNQILMKKLNPGQPEIGISLIPDYDYEKAFKYLEIIAQFPEDGFPIPGGNKIKVPEITIARVIDVLERTILICATLGTIVWAYGPSLSAWIVLGFA